MQKYSNLSKLSNTKFRRCTGITRHHFEVCVQIVKEYENQTKIKDGRPSNLTIEDQMLMLCEYYRENRTFFHLGTSYGLSESNAYRTIIKLENILIKSDCCRLDGKKALLTDKYIKTVLVDVTETPAQRPKKKGGIKNLSNVHQNRDENIAGKRNVIPIKYN